MTFRSTLLAATLLAAPLAAPLAARADTVTGVYVGIGAGANFESSSQINSVRLGNTSINTGLGKLRQRFNTGYRLDASVGYGFGNGLRTELEGTFFDSGIRSIGRFSNGGGVSGSNFVPATTAVTGDRQKYGGFVNVLYDVDLARFGIDTALTPYIGAGVGYLQARNQGVNYVQGNQALIHSTGTDGNFAYQAIIGVAYPLPFAPGLAATVDYRFSSVPGALVFKGQYFAGNQITSARIRENGAYNNTVMVGLRYAFNAAPPPVEAAPAPVPQQNVPRTYLVFFDWDRSDLTDRARQIIGEAARATTQTQVTRIMVSGHTDTTGTARYNQGLSVRRAQVVAGELVRDGVPQSAITTAGYGFSRPLVATGPNVREPQNRRVEIVLQ